MAGRYSFSKACEYWMYRSSVGSSVVFIRALAESTAACIALGDTMEDMLLMRM